MPFHHGGDWAGFYEAHRSYPLDFSASISPLGLPRGVREAVVSALDRADRYPDPLCRELRRALGDALGVPSGRILCGNGAGDLIDRAVLAVRPRQALVTAPSFSEYSASLRRVGCEVREHHLRQQNGFHLTEAVLADITPDTDMVFLCEPNNPTGVTTDPDLLQQVLDRCDRCGTLLVADQCFNGLLSDPEEHTLLPDLERHRLLILDAFTKLYAMPGLRLGFALCADEGLLEDMRQSGQPWPVSVLAMAAGIAALEDRDYPVRLRRLLDGQRPILREGLARLGATDVTGDANFLLFRHRDRDLADKLETEGILIRRCADFSSLGPNWFRVAVRTAEENLRLLEAVRQVTQ